MSAAGPAGFNGNSFKQIRSPEIFIVVVLVLAISVLVQREGALER
jgi:hypothetical protein